MDLIDFNKFKKLQSLLKSMGAELKEMEDKSSWNKITDEELDKILGNEGLEVSFDDIDKTNGIFEYEGRKVVVFIRDQYASYRRSNSGYKFHLTHCSTISSAMKNNRKSRYVVSTRKDGLFAINIIKNNVVVDKNLITKLNICKNCLMSINYKGYKYDYKNKEEIFRNFELSEYFDQFSNTEMFEAGFRDIATAPKNIYSKDFNYISNKIKSIYQYKCAECGIDLSKKSHRQYLHTHHKDADKSNNSTLNLEPLCIECHAKQPGHSSMAYQTKYQEFLRIKKLIEVD